MRLRTLIAIALVLASVTVAPATSAAPDRGVTDACPADAPDAFVDDDGSVHEANIDCIAYWGITTGVTATEYAPAAGTRRDQMATFVGNFMSVAGFTLVATPVDAFADDEASVHELNVNRLAAAGVVAGVGGDAYAPAALVRRDQMATLVANAIEAVMRAPIPAGVDAFVDDVGNPHEDNVDKLAGIGVVVGQTPTTYNPGAWVRRDQMASFLAKAADYLAEAGHWPVFGTNETFRVVPRSAATLAVGEKRTYTAFVGDAEEIGVGLAYCDEVSVGATVSFGSYTLGGYEGALEPADDVVTFDVSGGEAGECERPVVIADLDGDGALDLDAGGRPTEPFGVGGPVTWTSGTGGGGGGGEGSAFIVDARAVDDVALGVVDAGDVHQLIFSSPMPATADDPGMAYTVVSPGATKTVELGTNAAGVLMPAGTYNGEAYPARQVMRVYLRDQIQAAAVAGAEGVAYPATITAVPAAWNVNLAESDTVLEAAAVTPVPEPDDVGPNMFIAVSDEANIITVTYTETVVCDGGLGQFEFTDSDNAVGVAPTSLDCSGATVALTFPVGVVDAFDKDPNLRYVDDSALTDANDVRDVNGNGANSPDNILILFAL